MKTESFLCEGNFYIAARNEQDAYDEAFLWYPPAMGWEVVEVVESQLQGHHRVSPLFNEILQEGGQVYLAKIKDNIDIFTGREQ